MAKKQQLEVLLEGQGRLPFQFLKPDPWPLVLFHHHRCTPPPPSNTSSHITSTTTRRNNLRLLDICIRGIPGYAKNSIIILSHCRSNYVVRSTAETRTEEIRVGKVFALELVVKGLLW